VAVGRRNEDRRSARVVPPEAGVLADPVDEDSLAMRCAIAAALPSPNPAAPAAAEMHDVSLQAERWRRFSSEPLEVLEPDLDEGRMASSSS